MASKKKREKQPTLQSLIVTLIALITNNMSMAPGCQISSLSPAM